MYPHDSKFINLTKEYVADFKQLVVLIISNLTGLNFSEYVRV